MTQIARTATTQFSSTFRNARSVVISVLASFAGVC
jgi:hypothetical protein